MLNKILILILVTLVPAFELRASIPLGILKGSVHLPFGLSLSGFGMNFILVFFICVLTNMILGPLVYLFLDKVIHLFLKIKIIDKCYNMVVERTQKKIGKWVDRYGDWGIALFIAIPLPGSGSYTGALGAYLLGLSYKKFIIANAIGVTIAGILVTIIILAGQGVFNWVF